MYQYPVTSNFHHILFIIIFLKYITLFMAILILKNVYWKLEAKFTRDSHHKIYVCHVLNTISMNPRALSTNVRKKMITFRLISYTPWAKKKNKYEEKFNPQPIKVNHFSYFYVWYPISTSYHTIHITHGKMSLPLDFMSSLWCAALKK